MNTTRQFGLHFAFLLLLLCLLTSTANAGFLYALNSNESANQIYGFSVNETTGILSALPGFPVATGGRGGFGDPELLTIDLVNRRLYALNAVSSTVSAYSINTATGALTPLPFSPIALGSVDWTTISVHPTGSPLIVANYGNGSGPTAVARLASFKITPTSATPAPGSPYTISGNPYSTVFSRNGANLYVGSKNAQYLHGYAVTPETGALTQLPGSPYNGGFDPLALVTDSQNRLFAANSLGGQVRAFTTETGIPTTLTVSPSGLVNARDGVLHPNEQFYFVTDVEGNRVGAYRISGSGAATALTPVAGSPFPTSGAETYSLVINRAGTFLYVINLASRNITTFAVNSTSGVLTLQSIQPPDTLGANGDGTSIAYFGVTASQPTLFDFDGDGKADISVFRPSTGTWYLLQSNLNNSVAATAQFGISTDKLTPADFDGDGRTDIAVFRDGTWYWLNSSNGSFSGAQFGQAGDVPVPADYTGDGRAEIAVYRDGIWYTLNLANNQFQAVQFGISTDKAVPADYDGDGKTDFAVYRDGIWYLLRSRDEFTSILFGEANDKPVPADYDGDGKADIAVFRPSNGIWYLQRSTAGFTGIAFGLGTDLPVPADYDGDGKADVAVFRNGTWYIQRSQSGFTGVTFGASNDKPVPNAFVP